jgi:hypothetical protein
MKNPIIFIAALAAVAGCSTAPSFQEGPDAEISFDGLTRVDNTNMNMAWARTDIDLTSFNKVMIERVAVEFRAIEGGPVSGQAGRGAVSASSRNRNQFRLDESTKEMFIEEISGAAREEFSSSDVFEIVQEPGYDVLLIRVALLDVVSRVPPEPVGRSAIWLDTIGEATLVLEVRDSMSNAIFARTVDRRAAGDRPGGVQSNAVTNRSEVRRLGRRWAQIARTGLETLMTEGM